MIFDPFGIGGTFLKLQQAWASHPREWQQEQQRLMTDLWTLNLQGIASIVGGRPSLCAQVAEGDDRFADPAWKDDPFHCLLLQNYLTQTRWLERVIYDTPGLPRGERRRGAFWIRQWIDALAPTNFPLINPAVIRKALQSNGASLLKGVRNLLEDVKAGDVQMVDKAAFAIGKNLATTSGTVVFRNDKLELIQYHPLTEQVHAIPIVIVPPWINKFYILDLNEKKSMVRHLLAHGFSVFIISWKNPRPEMADTGFENYVLGGVLAAIDAARSICQVAQVHAVGYCIGGTALAALMAWLNRKYDDPDKVPVAHWTLLASLVDFSRPGEIETFLNEESIATVDAMMARQGYLDKEQIGWSFRMLRPNSLLWHDVVHKYLYGEKPIPFDVLFWNSDGTRIPRALHSFCLHQFYLENKLAAKDGIVLAGHPLDIARVRQPLYAVGAVDDHITPWLGTFNTTSLVRAPVRYALSSSGHILGIINPPDARSKRAHWVGYASGETDGKAWLAAHVKQAGSWWGDWVKWLGACCGPQQAPPPTGRGQYQALCAAPGTYVHER